MVTTLLFTDLCTLGFRSITSLSFDSYMSPVSARLHHRETKSVENDSQECIVHSWESKEAENAADEIIRKPKVHSSVYL